VGPYNRSPPQGEFVCVQRGSYNPGPLWRALPFARFAFVPYVCQWQPHKTASGTISESPLVLTDIVADDGTVGHSMIFTYAVAALKPTADLIKNLESCVKGEPLAPAEIADKFVKRFRLLGLQELIAMAVAAIDMALWNALARSHKTSLVRLLG
jgi:mandelate racemase